jgi:hypothetical protein
VSSAFKLTSKERKLLTLMLDSAAAQGEISTSALKFAQSLRARGVEAHAIEQTLASADQPPVRQFGPDLGLCAMPWGKNKGKPFCEIFAERTALCSALGQKKTRSRAQVRRLHPGRAGISQPGIILSCRITPTLRPQISCSRGTQQHCQRLAFRRSLSSWTGLSR